MPFHIPSTTSTGEGGPETDPNVGAITGIVKADGAGNISAATADTDYTVPATLAAITDGSAGADLIGVTPLYEGGETLLQAVLEYLKGLCDDFVSGEGFLALDQTTRQDVTGGAPNLTEGAVIEVDSWVSGVLRGLSAYNIAGSTPWKIGGVEFTPGDNYGGRVTISVSPNDGTSTDAVVRYQFSCDGKFTIIAADGTTAVYSLPNADGQANDVITTDGAGVATFSPILRYPEFRIGDGDNVIVADALDFWFVPSSFNGWEITAEETADDGDVTLTWTIGGSAFASPLPQVLATGDYIALTASGEAITATAAQGHLTIRRPDPVA